MRAKGRKYMGEIGGSKRENYVNIISKIKKSIMKRVVLVVKNCTLKGVRFTQLNPRGSLKCNSCI